ncbi:MAG: dihydropteroate synthase [Candidatus Aegiribacteria sp.]|nr:dihydropteroate synthase [Candidatus Aegiribacteria sp.]
MRIRKLHISSDDQWRRELVFIGADPVTWNRLSVKCRVSVFSTGLLSVTAANILKQCMLSGGADAIVSRKTVSGKASETRALIVGTTKQLLQGCESLIGQPFGLPELALELRIALKGFPFLPQKILTCGKVLDFSRRPLVMGILNVTSDSFSDGGNFLDTEAAVEHARSMTSQGADIIDIGAESTRPGSLPVPPAIQLERLLPILKRFSGDCRAVISVDTASAEVADAVLSAGAEMINDVTAMSDPAMPEVVANANVPVVLMHMQGKPETMQNNPRYTDVVEEIYTFFQKRITVAAESGISRERIFVDPGIGFGKKLKDNIQLISRLAEFKWLGCRVLLGHSRKSFLGMLTGIEKPSALEAGTHAVTALSSNFADIVRVHDVEGTLQVLKISREFGQRI